MALTKKALNDHFLHSFGQVDEPVRSMTGNDGLIIGGICENAGTITAVEHGDFAALHFDNDQNLMVNIQAGEVVASLGTVNLLKSGTVTLLKAGTVTSVGNLAGGTVGVVTSVANLAAGTITSVGNLVGGTVTSVGNLVGGTVTSIGNLVGGTVGVVSSVSNLAAGTVTVLSTLTGGGVAANAADSGNPVKIGGKYTAAGVTLDDGDRGDLALDSKSNANVNLNTLISGEDQTNDLIKTEHRYEYYHYVGTVAGTVKTSAGFIHAITVNKAGTSDLTVYDSVGTSATVIGIISGSVEQTKIYDVSTTTGITVLGTSAIDVTISWR